MKSKEQLAAERFSLQCFSHAHLKERFKVDKMRFGTEQQKTEFEVELSMC